MTHRVGCPNSAGHYIKTIEKFDEILVGVIVTLTAQHRFIIFSTILRQSIEKCLLYAGKKI
jgi:hypothetical protein